MDQTLTQEETQNLIRLCQSGRLYEVRDWILSGKSLRLAPESKKTILTIAIKTGFHSLVQLIAPHETQEARNQGLADAVSLRRLDFLELLVANGADIKAVPFINVLLCWDPRIIRFFIDNGADVITGSPFALAYGERIRTALRPFLECKQRHPELAIALQEQADRTLRTFAYDGDLKWVSLLLWAGADPRTRGPKLGDEQYGLVDDDIDTTALNEACYRDNPDVLKRLKPNPERDNLSDLLNCASTLSRKEVIKYLLGIGAKPNDKANGGSTAMDRCLSHLPHGDINAVFSRRQVSQWGVRRTLESLTELAQNGAIWKPDNSREMEYVRRGLYRAEPEVTMTLIEMFLKSKCCSEETLRELLRTPRIRQHLKPCEKKLRRLLGLDLRTASEKAEEARVQAARQSYVLLGRHNREQLYEEVWSEPMQKVARKYQLSDVGLAKVCKKLNIPKPGLGYWAKKAAGKPIPKRPPLPTLQNPIRE